MRAGAVAEVGAALVDLVFPRRCAACGEPPVPGEPFCGVCREAVDDVPAGCPRCGRPGGDRCAPCAAAPPPFDALSAAALFGGPVADAVHALKFGGRAAVAGPLGGWMASRLALPAGGAVVAVPLGRKRLQARGYDQAALLASAIARRARLPRLPAALVRVRETAPQATLDRVAREENVRGAFEARGAVRGREVILVDDVVTTGATAAAAARALREAGARSVRVVALARAM